jgi:hypothetical protein
MKEKKYSIEHIQTIIDIGPAELQKLIRKNSRHLNLIREENEQGKKEIYLDEPSLQRLLFIKQLEKGGDISRGAVCEIIKTPQIPGKKGDRPSADYYDRINLTLNAVTAEAGLLQEQLGSLILKYDHLIKELNLVRAKNILLEKEISTLRNREAALMGHLRQSAENLDEEELKNQLFN